MAKKRVSLTLEKSIVNRIDSESSRRDLNRSETVEEIVKKYFKQSELSVGVIFCGDMELCQMEHGESTFLKHNIRLLEKYVSKIYILSGKKKQEAREEIKSMDSRCETEVLEDSKAGTAKALNKLSDRIDSTFVAVNGHVKADVNLNDMKTFHEDNGRCATVGLTPMNDPSKYGVVSMKGTKIQSFNYQPQPGKESSKLVNAGVYVFSNEIFDNLDKDQLDSVFDELAEASELTGYVFGGKWAVAKKISSSD